MEVKYNLRKRKIESVIKSEFPQTKALLTNSIKLEITKKSNFKKEHVDKIKTDFTYNQKNDTENCASYCTFCEKYYSSRYCDHLLEQNKIPCNMCDEMLMIANAKQHICNVICPSRSKLDAHFRMHSRIEKRKSLVIVDQCSKEHCDTKIDSGQLKKRKLSRSDLTCTICGKISRRKHSFKIHNNIHKKNQAFPCNECDQSFQYLLHLAKHVSIVHRHYPPSSTQCPICLKMVSAIGAHLRIHQDSPMDCVICGATLKNYSAHKAHMRWHSILADKGRDRTITPRPILSMQNGVCLICKKKFRDSHQLNKHMTSHMKVAEFPCPYCDADQCCSQEDLIQHISSRHRSLPDGYSRCPICAQTVTDIGSHLKTHILAVYECEMCTDVTFSTYADCRQHINKKHRKKKNTHRHYMDVFMAKYKSSIIRNGGKKVACLICHDKVRVSHMLWHVNTTHRLLKCTECNKSVHNLDALHTHREHHRHWQHTNCPICKHSFISHIRLMAHIKMVHKTPFSISRACSRC